MFSGVAAAQTGGDFVFRLGYDMSGEMDADFSIDGSTEEDMSDTVDVESGYSLTAEYRLSAADNFSYGAGITYQLDRDIDEEDTDVSFSFTPIYLLGEYRMADNPIYFVGHLGYNFFSLDDLDLDEENLDIIDQSNSGGLYYALGGGIEFEDRYLLELLYTVNNGSTEIEFEGAEVPNGNGAEDGVLEGDFKYTKFTISLGVKF